MKKYDSSLTDISDLYHQLQQQHQLSSEQQQQPPQLAQSSQQSLQRKANNSNSSMSQSQFQTTPAASSINFPPHHTRNLSKQPLEHNGYSAQRSQQQQLGAQSLNPIYLQSNPSAQGSLNTNVYTPTNSSIPITYQQQQGIASESSPEFWNQQQQIYSQNRYSAAIQRQSSRGISSSGWITIDDPNSNSSLHIETTPSDSQLQAQARHMMNEVSRCGANLSCAICDQNVCDFCTDHNKQHQTVRLEQLSQIFLKSELSQNYYTSAEKAFNTNAERIETVERSFQMYQQTVKSLLDGMLYNFKLAEALRRQDFKTVGNIFRKYYEMATPSPDKSPSFHLKKENDTKAEVEVKFDAAHERLSTFISQMKSIIIESVYSLQTHPIFSQSYQPFYSPTSSQQPQHLVQQKQPVQHSQIQQQAQSQLTPQPSSQQQSQQLQSQQQLNYYNSASIRGNVLSNTKIGNRLESQQQQQQIGPLSQSQQQSYLNPSLSVNHTDRFTELPQNLTTHPQLTSGFSSQQSQQQQQSSQVQAIQNQQKNMGNSKSNVFASRTTQIVERNGMQSQNSKQEMKQSNSSPAQAQSLTYSNSTAVINSGSSSMNQNAITSSTNEMHNINGSSLRPTKSSTKEQQIRSRPPLENENDPKKKVCLNIKMNPYTTSQQNISPGSSQIENGQSVVGESQIQQQSEFNSLQTLQQQQQHQQNLKLAYSPPTLGPSVKSDFISQRGVLGSFGLFTGNPLNNDQIQEQANKPKKHHSQKTKQRALFQYYNERTTTKEIALRYDVVEATVKHWIQDDRKKNHQILLQNLSPEKEAHMKNRILEVSLLEPSQNDGLSPLLFERQEIHYLNGIGASAVGAGRTTGKALNRMNYSQRIINLSSSNYPSNKYSSEISHMVKNQSVLDAKDNQKSIFNGVNTKSNSSRAKSIFENENSSSSDSQESLRSHSLGSARVISQRTDLKMKVNQDDLEAEKFVSEEAEDEYSDNFSHLSSENNIQSQNSSRNNNNNNNNTNKNNNKRKDSLNSEENRQSSQKYDFEDGGRQINIDDGEKIHNEEKLHSKAASEDQNQKSIEFLEINAQNTIFQAPANPKTELEEFRYENSQMSHTLPHPTPTFASHHESARQAVNQIEEAEAYETLGAFGDFEGNQMKENQHFSKKNNRQYFDRQNQKDGQHDNRKAFLQADAIAIEPNIYAMRLACFQLKNNRGYPKVRVGSTVMVMSKGFEISLQVEDIKQENTWIEIQKCSVNSKSLISDLKVVTSKNESIVFVLCGNRELYIWQWQSRSEPMLIIDKAINFDAFVFEDASISSSTADFPPVLIAAQVDRMRIQIIDPFSTEILEDLPNVSPSIFGNSKEHCVANIVAWSPISSLQDPTIYICCNSGSYFWAIQVSFTGDKNHPPQMGLLYETFSDDHQDIFRMRLHRNSIGFQEIIAASDTGFLYIIDIVKGTQVYCKTKQQGEKKMKDIVIFHPQSGASNQLGIDADISQNSINNPYDPKIILCYDNFLRVRKHKKLQFPSEMRCATLEVKDSEIIIYYVLQNSDQIQRHPIHFNS